MIEQMTEHGAWPFAERVITMTPRDRSRRDFMRRIDRMMLCLADAYSREGTCQELAVELLGFEGSARGRTLRFRYRLVPAPRAPLAHSAAA
ncbi:MAG: hypothetical protein HGA45_27245 [Chloroflexales bacterium]|nr:hypothetical protein [Chloroflexales bacterium]